TTSATSSASSSGRTCRSPPPEWITYHPTMRRRSKRWRGSWGRSSSAGSITHASCSGAAATSCSAATRRAAASPPTPPPPRCRPRPARRGGGAATPPFSRHDRDRPPLQRRRKGVRPGAPLERARTVEAVAHPGGAKGQGERGKGGGQSGKGGGAKGGGIWA